MTRKNIKTIQSFKNQQKIVVLTAYTAPFARVLDTHCDILLVGDSLGMVLYGLDSTLPVTLEMMAQHGKAVVKASSNALVVVDMPFGSYQQSPSQAFESAAYLLAETGAQAVKLEGGETFAPTIEFLVKRGIPVMAHVGLMPQYFNMHGGFKKQGKTLDEQSQIKADAHAVQKAGAFSVVIEATDGTLAREISEALTIPTIGIGADVDCDGQVLVTEDMVGLSGDYVPSFVKKFGELGDALDKAVANYAAAVRGKKFP
jgi:3-methyl-2-oxobutanoate hydroxymethyltransferase